MRLFFIALFLSVFLLSCTDDNHQPTNQVTKTDTIKQAEEVDSTQVDKEPAQYKLGEDYIELPTPYDTQDKSHVIVYEFFGYTCPHCFHFEPFINKWLAEKPSYAVLKRVPLNFQPGWAIFQQGYLTAETMGIANKTHTQLFDALHKDHKRFRSIDDLASWYAEETGIDKDGFLSTAESFILDSAQRKADSMGFKMQITGTPTLVVNGKYKVSPKIKDRDYTIKVLEFLVEKEAAEMGLVTQ